MTDRRHKSLEIGSYAELLRREREILERIERMPNGGNLFLAHPFRLLADVGVVLAKKVEEEIRALHPELSGLGDGPYEALKASEQPQNVRFNVKGLFRRREE
ncbi:MAG TPA: hypothetical protein VGL03_10040 [Thermoanaerobaculia bacterium]